MKDSTVRACGEVAAGAQGAKRDDMAAPPTLAICAILRDERRYLLEWIAYHQLLGVSRFLLFDNQSADGSQLVLAELKRLGLLDAVRVEGRGPPVQPTAYLAGAQFLAGKVDFVAFIDLDEFLVAAPDLPSQLADTPADVGAIGVCQTVFGSNAQARYASDLVISRFTARAQDERAEHRWVKIIARPEAVAAFTSSHSVTLTQGWQAMTDGGPFVAAAYPGQANRICHARIRLHHYMLKSREEFSWKRQRGALSDADGRVRFTEAYFSERDPGSNAVMDLAAASRAEAVRQRMRALFARFSPEARAALADLAL
jgi:hypothetical protein